MTKKQTKIETVKLPPLTKLKGTKTKDPVTLFWDHFIKKSSVEETQKLFDTMFVTRAYYESLTKLTVAWVKKHHSLLSERRQDFLIGTHLLNMGPASFDKKQPHEKKGLGYLKNEK